MKDYTDKAWILVVILCVIFWLVGCATKDEAVGGFPVEEKLRPNGWNDHYWIANDTKEAETFPLEEEEPIEETIIHEDPVLDLLIDLNIVETI